MSRAGTFILRAVVSVLCCAPGLAFPQAERPQHDLFARPAQAAMHRLKHQADAGPAVREVPWTPQLRAVMVAGPDSMVNVDGAMVRIGEELRGYRLVEVRDGEAVFAKGGKRFTVAMRGGAPDPEETREKR